MLWWLGALASGPEAYATFTGWMWADLAKLEWSSAGAIFASLVKIVLKLVAPIGDPRRGEELIGEELDRLIPMIRRLECQLGGRERVAPVGHGGHLA